MSVANFLNSNWLIAIIIVAPLMAVLVKKRKYFLKLFLPTESITIFLVQTTKKLTAQTRPFLHQPQVLGVASNIPSDFSFPSLHTALGTLFAWIMSSVYPKFSWLWFGMLTAIAVSRVELGFHYPRDIFGGFLLATFIFWFFYLLAKTKKALGWSQDVNIRRKLVHLFYGLILVFLLDYQLVSDKQFFYWLVFSFLVVILSPILPDAFRKIINYFEREKSKKFLALGPFLFTLSSFLSWFIFSKNIAIASIINLAVGDSVNALAGSFWRAGKKTGKEKSKKRIGAALAAAFAALLINSQYLSFGQAAAGSLATLLFEFSEPKINGKRVDDNFLIPLVAGLTMTLLPS